MSTALKVEQSDDAERVRRAARNYSVGQRVILALGKPTDLLQVQVREVWERRYRVNIYVGANVATARVAHSYFLEIDDDGNIVSSVPKLGRQYELPSPVPAAGAVARA